MKRVDFYFDFISPYSWLALMQAADFGASNGVSWRLRPVLYSALLDAHRLVGPAESPAKRRYTFLDIVRLAAVHGYRLSGPPAHPFRSIEALRTATLFRDDARVLELAVALSDACWGSGADLADPGTLTRIVKDAGFEAARLHERIADPAIKDALREQTEAAIEKGIFGVPTFATDGELFWGHDRLPLLAAKLRGELPDTASAARTMLDRPRAVDRKRRP